MTNNSLMLHIDIHKGEKKFECQYCDYRFRRKEKLLNHEKIHTGRLTLVFFFLIAKSSLQTF